MTTVCCPLELAVASDPTLDELHVRGLEAFGSKPGREGSPQQRRRLEPPPCSPSYLRGSCCAGGSARCGALVPVSAPHVSPACTRVGVHLQRGVTGGT